MIVAVGCDHGAWEYKKEIIRMLKDEGHEVLEFGCEAGEACDYPDVAEETACCVAEGRADTGILLCGTGIGISIAANKIPGIRCALCTDVTMARLTRDHNDANMLAMGQRTSGLETCKDIVRAFLSTPFSQGERHKGRIAKIAQLEDQNLE
jgi:ribose 5-phosphate isomerase B